MNADCARRRRQRACSLPRSEGAGPVALPDGAVSEVPPDDEVVPDFPTSALMPHLNSPFIDLDSAREEERASVVPSVNLTTPARAEDEPIARRPPRPCSASQATRPKGDAALQAEYQLPPGSTEDFMYFAESDSGHACRHPVRGWPAFEEVFPKDNPICPVRHHLFQCCQLAGLAEGSRGHLCGEYVPRVRGARLGRGEPGGAS